MGAFARRPATPLKSYEFAVWVPLVHGGKPWSSYQEVTAFSFDHAAIRAMEKIAPDVDEWQAIVGTVTDPVTVHVRKLKGKLGQQFRVHPSFDLSWYSEKVKTK